MKQFMLIIRSEKIDFSKFLAKDFENFMMEYGKWTEELVSAKKFISGEKLTENLGKTLRKNGNSIAVEGPYADSKDAISGFYIVQAKNEAAAIEIANGCPSVKLGGSVEVREVEQLES